MCVCTAYTDLISRQHAAKPRLSSERDSNALGALTGKGVVEVGAGGLALMQGCGFAAAAGAGTRTGTGGNYHTGSG